MRANAAQPVPFQFRGKDGIVFERFQAVPVQMDNHTAVLCRLQWFVDVGKFSVNFQLTPSTDNLTHQGKTFSRDALWVEIGFSLARNANVMFKGRDGGPHFSLSRVATLVPQPCSAFSSGSGLMKQFGR
mgnify:CR=1 FL=1